jgi:thiol-disulfide isomerase/thioredoxin
LSARGEIRSRALGVILLILAQGSVANAGEELLAPLVKALELRAYSSATIPPNFSGNTVDDREVSLAKLRGKVLIVNFWASWCAECRPEMPVLERLHREHAAHGLAVIGVNARENSGTVRRYARELDLTFPLVLDPRGAINTLYGVVGLPTTFLIGRDGRAVAFGVGPREWGSPSAQTLIETLLSEPAPRPGRP